MRRPCGVGARRSRDSERRGRGVWFRLTGGGLEELGLGKSEKPPGVGVDIVSRIVCFKQSDVAGVVYFFSEEVFSEEGSRYWCPVLVSGEKAMDGVSK